MKRRLLLIGLALALVSGLALVGQAAWQRWNRSDFESALHVVPKNAKRVAFTDWQRVRTTLKVKPGQDVAAWLDRSYSRDLAAGSSMDEAAAAMQEHFGFSPANVEWEIFAQARDGAAMVVKLPDDVDFDSLARKLAHAGFTRPAKADQVWRGGVDLIPTLDPTLTPEVQFIALLRDQRMVVTSDSREYAAATADVVRGDAASLQDDDAAPTLVSQVGNPHSAILWAGDFACEDLSMASADDDAQRLAKQAIADAGGISPVTGLVMALGDESLTIVAQFPDSEEAVSNLKTRARLAVGPAIGRDSGNFSDDLELESSRTHDATMLLEFRPKNPDAFPLSRLYDGPVVFAGC